MPIEIAEYIFDPTTKTEHYETLRYLGVGDDHSLQFNTRPITGVDETLTIALPGSVVRGGGATFWLDDPAEERILSPEQNYVRMRELFITGPTGRVVLIRRLPATLRVAR